PPPPGRMPTAGAVTDGRIHRPVPGQTGEQLPIPVSAPAGPPPEFRVQTPTGEHPQIRPVPRGEDAATPEYVVRAKAEPRHAPPPYIVRPQPDQPAPPRPAQASPTVPMAAPPTPVFPTAAPSGRVPSDASVPVPAEAPAEVPAEAPLQSDLSVSPAAALVRPDAAPAAETSTTADSDGGPAPLPDQLNSGPADTDPAGTDPVDTDPVDTDPVDTDPAAGPTDDPTGTAPDDNDGGSGPTGPPASPDTVLPVTGTAAGSATALGAPTMLAPLVQPDQPADEPDPAPDPETAPDETEPQLSDPEQMLSSYHWRFHHETLRELVDNPDEFRAIRDRLTEKIEPATDNATRARLLSLRAVVSRILGDLGKALADAKLALAHAEATGELRRVAIAQARLAHVLQWRGDFAEADRLFEEANSAELPDRLRATMHEHAGRSCYDQGRYMEACNHFERALELRKVEDPDLIARTELALDAVFAKVAENGWGPYPRDREEILRLHRPPRPTFNDRAQQWGYAGVDGELVIAPGYADVQPFHEGVAWVRRPEAKWWELIDESGTTVIAPTAGYIGVGSFSDGLAWVTADGTGSWIAIDRNNTVVIGTGFEDVRPFRRGVAVVRRGGWGAVDKTGRMLLPPRFGGFPTALTDGRYIDGFTDEGLAIIDSGGRKGVVDRSGRMVVPPVHPAMAIHPVAFLVAAPNGHWGALDRRGEPLIDPVLPSRADVMDEIDRLLADTKPLL
ncbi:WG repeat-containing protein, partial [Solwaraspora sp. WMMA2080]